MLRYEIEKQIIAILRYYEFHEEFLKLLEDQKVSHFKIYITWMHLEICVAFIRMMIENVSDI